MAASRKTISVAKVLHMANTFMANPKSTRDERVAIDAFISGVLHETGNYRGFAVKEDAEVPIYSDAAPYRHFYFPSGTIVDEYDALSAEII